MPRRRYRQPRIGWLAFVVVLIALPLTLALPPLLPLLLVPAAFALWVVRSETLVEPEGVTVRGLLRTRRVRWDEVSAIEKRRSGGLVGPVRLHTTDGGTLDLPYVTRADVADLRAIAEGRPLRPAAPPAGPAS